MLESGMIICLSGELGAGKTAFTRGLASGWGTDNPVTSPTFTLVNTYRRESDSLIFYHIDCYRLTSEADAWSIGLDDILDGEGVVVFEWPERIKNILPPEYLWVKIEPIEEESRRFTFETKGVAYRRIFDTLS